MSGTNVTSEFPDRQTHYLFKISLKSRLSPFRLPPHEMAPLSSPLGLSIVRNGSKSSSVEEHEGPDTTEAVIIAGRALADGLFRQSRFGECDSDLFFSH